MIDFACKKFDINEVVKCSLGLSRSDMKLFLVLLQHPEHEFSTADLSKKMKTDLSTAQRGVKKLAEKQILVRRQINFTNGGYEFVYRLVDKDKIRGVILGTVNAWVRTVSKELENW